MRFKEFLAESSTGVDKWKKYFSDVEQFTKMKADAPLYSVDGTRIAGKTISKGEVITVPVDDNYNSKILITWNDDHYRVSINAVDKPIAVVDKMQLKPDFFEIGGTFGASDFEKEIIKLINKHKEISDDLKDYLIELVKHASGDNNTKKLKDAHDKIAEEPKVLATINKDFLEVLGPMYAREYLDLPKSVDYLFPLAGNEPLFDFKIIDGDKEYMFSSKAGKSPNTNTIKPPVVLSKVEHEPKFRRNKAAIKVLHIICNTPIKSTPKALSVFIKDEYNEIIEVPEISDLHGVFAAERKIVDFLNSKLDFIDMLNFSLPELYFIKLKLDSDGKVEKPDISHGKTLTKAKLRSKNSPGHYVDRIGFQL